MASGLTKFKINDPLPVCGHWKEHMPATRDAATYRLYIEARKLWRSKIAWQLTRDENTRILHDGHGAVLVCARIWPSSVQTCNTNGDIQPIRGGDKNISGWSEIWQ